VVDPKLRRTAPAPDRAPDIRDVLARFAWHADALCAEDNRPEDTKEGDWFPEDGGRYDPGSPAWVLPILVCSGCPVRKACAGDALRVYKFSRRDDKFATSCPVGIRGGTTWHDRQAVAHLPVPEAVDVLEASLADRVAVRVAAWRSRPRGATTGRRERALAALLGVTPSERPPEADARGDFPTIVAQPTP
jgi:hypothetical protein